jgi:2-polyprenyl-6-methoxyphenol hydroxylase-like FAD-dependent oxidoreductase
MSLQSIIFGGGVAGLATAVALRSTPLGGSVRLFERRASNAAKGMGFLVMPNGMRALRRLAPRVDWSGLGRSVERLVVRDSHGGFLAETPLTSVACFGREQLLAALESLVGEAEIRYEQSLVGLRRSSRGDVEAAELEDGSTVAGDVFFGCDGSRSRTRAILFPRATLGPGVVEEVVITLRSRELASRLGHTFHKYYCQHGGIAVGLLAESEDRVVWFVQFDARQRSSQEGGADQLRDFVSRLLSDWPEAVRAAVELTDFGQAHRWQPRDLLPLRHLHDRNVVLMGDAAHACLPFTSQGANGALQDAVVMRDALRDVEVTGDLEEAFSVYAALRRPEHRRVFYAGRRLRTEFLKPHSGRAPSVPLVG